MSERHTHKFVSWLVDGGGVENEYLTFDGLWFDFYEY